VNKDEINRAIAEACGWTFIPDDTVQFVACRPDGKWDNVPDYTGCLNAIHEAKRKLLDTGIKCDLFNGFLLEEKPMRSEIIDEIDKWTWGQSAEVQCRCLLKALNLWRAEP
jgi:rubredoxin